MGSLGSSVGGGRRHLRRRKLKSRHHGMFLPVGLGTFALSDQSPIDSHESRVQKLAFRCAWRKAATVLNNWWRVQAFELKENGKTTFLKKFQGTMSHSARGSRLLLRIASRRGLFMATRYACKQCSFSIVLSGGRFLACPRCFGELEVTEVPDRPKRPSTESPRDERREGKNRLE